VGRALLDVCQKLTDAVNVIVGWQLESTTWLKRTLVVKQDPTGSQRAIDISGGGGMIGPGGTAPTVSTFASEASSMRGSTISLAGANPNTSGGGNSNRLSSIADGVSHAGSMATLSQSNSDGVGTARKSASTLRASVKDPAKKDPTDSTQALFLLAENLTELIDSITRSEDKEKMVPTLQAVWGNTLPYLKAKK